MDRLKRIALVAKVLELGSMSAAAAALGMTPSAVSQHIRSLEDEYRVKLLHRTTRNLSPTEEGKRLWEYGKRLIDIEAAADRDMRRLQGHPEGEVRLAVPSGKSEVEVLQNTVLALQVRYPKIQLVLLEDDRITDIVATEIDIALRFVEQAEGDNLVARYLTTWETGIFAAPSYLDRHPVLTEKDLLGCNWINHSDQVLIDTMTIAGLPGELPILRTDCPGRVSAARGLVRGGLGLAVLFDEDVASDLREGKLKPVLPHISLPKRNVYAITAHRDAPARVAAVLGLLTENFRKTAS